MGIGFLPWVVGRREFWGPFLVCGGSVTLLKLQGREFGEFPHPLWDPFLPPRVLKKEIWAALDFWDNFSLLRILGNTGVTPPFPMF